MAPRTTYAALSFGPNPFSLFDQSFADTDNRTFIQCTVAGTNALTLTPITAAFPPNVVYSTFYGMFIFVAGNTSTGNITAKVDGQPVLNVYTSSSVQATTNNILAGNIYGLVYSASLNSNAGGFYLISLGAEPFSIVIGTTTITGGTPNGLLYDNAGVLGNLVTANNGVLVTSAGGVPSISSTLPSGLTIPSPSLTVTPTAPTATPGTNTTQIATTAFVQAAISFCSTAGALQVGIGSSSTQCTTQSAGASQFPILNTQAGTAAAFSFQDGGTLKWTVGKQTDNTFVIRDQVNTKTLVAVSPTGPVAITPVTDIWTQGLTVTNSLTTASAPSIGPPVTLNYISGTINAPNALTTVTNGLTNGFTSVFRADGFFGGANIGATSAVAIFTANYTTSGGTIAELDGTLHINYINISQPSGAAHASDSIVILDNGASLDHFGGIETSRVICDGSGAGGGGPASGSFCRSAGAGASSGKAYAISVISAGQKTATTLDTGIIVSNNGTTAARWPHFIAFSNYGGDVPMATTGDIFFSDTAMTIQHFANLSNVTVNGSALLFPNFNLTGSGKLALGTTSAPATGIIITATCASCGTTNIDASTNSTTGVGGVQSTTSGGANAYTLYANEAARTQTALGVASGNWITLVASGASNLGLVIETATAQPIKFGTNDTLAGLITGGQQWIVGSNVITPSSNTPLTISANASNSPATVNGQPYLHIVGANSQNATIQFNTFATSSTIAAARADGTAASPTAVVANDTVFSFGAFSYDGTNYDLSGAVAFVTTAVVANTSASGAIQFRAYTANTQKVIWLAPSGGLMLQNMATFSATNDPGTEGIYVNGVVNFATGLRIANAAASGHYLRGNGTNYVDGTIANGDLPGSGQITIGTTAIALGASSTTLAGLTQVTVDAAAATPITGNKLTVSSNTATSFVAPTLTGILHTIGADNVQNVALFDSSQSSGTNRNWFIIARNARGTIASPTATQNNDNLGFFGMVGATGAGTYAAENGTAGGVFFGAQATENWSGTNQGAKLRLFATANGTAAIAVYAEFGGANAWQAYNMGAGAGNGAICGATNVVNGTGGAVTFDSGANCIVSVREAKTDIVPLKNVLDEVMQLRPVQFKYKYGWGDDGAKTQIGLIAQDVEDIDSRLVAYSHEGDLTGVRYAQTVALAIRAIQELKEELDNVRQSINRGKS